MKGAIPQQRPISRPTEAACSAAMRDPTVAEQARRIAAVRSRMAQVADLQSRVLQDDDGRGPDHE
jgi:hypothetical protein